MPGGQAGYGGFGMNMGGYGYSGMGSPMPNVGYMQQDNGNHRRGRVSLI
jgi:protein JSN1